MYKGLSLEKLAEMSLQKPEDFGWYGDDDMFVTWGWAGIDVHRDSNILEVSNFEFITNDLMDRYPDDFKIVGIGHWAVGHVDRLTVRVLKNERDGFVEDNITDAFISAVNWLNQLEDYPVADEEHYSMMEYSENLNIIALTIPPFVEQYSGCEADIYERLLDNGVEMIPDAQVFPSEEDIVRVAYRLGMIDRNYQEEWGDACIAYGLPAIDWDASVIPSFLPMEGQMSLFDD